MADVATAGRLSRGAAYLLKRHDEHVDVERLTIDSLEAEELCEGDRTREILMSAVLAVKHLQNVGWGEVSRKTLQSLLSMADVPSDELSGIGRHLLPREGEPVRRRLRRRDVETVARKQAETAEQEVGRVATRHFRALCEGNSQGS